VYRKRTIYLINLLYSVRMGGDLGRPAKIVKVCLLLPGGEGGARNTVHTG
jgi:hypothetical protein